MAISKRLRYEIFRRDNHTCRYCGRSAPEVKLTIDHVVPDTLGGADEPSNLVTACEDCNSGKSATPPDAALVANVEADAVRWAEAQKVAARRMLAELAAHEELIEKFQKRWEYWTNVRGRRVYLDEGWSRSVESFLAAGLPMEVLLDALDRAMSKRDLARDAVFKYMCGIAWARIRKLREETAALVKSGQRPAEIGSDWAPLEQQYMEGWTVGRLEVAEEILEFFDPENKARFIAMARKSAEDEGDELGNDGPDDENAYLVGRAAWEAFHETWGLLHGLEMAARSLVEALPLELRARLEERARSDFETYDEVPDEHGLLRWMTFLVSYEIRENGIPKGTPREARF